MNERFALILLLGWPSLLMAQRALPAAPAPPPVLDPLHRLIAANDYAIAVEGAFDFNSNALLNELPAALWRGAYLDRALRSRSRDALRGRNSLGYRIDARITYLGKGESRWRPLISAAHHEHMGLRFAPGLFHLTFFGNAGYEQRRVDLAPTRFAHMRWQTIGFGAWDGRQGQYARLDLVMGQSLDAARIRWADLYTGADGRVLRSNVNGHYWRSDTASSKAGTLNGIGLAFSGRWLVPLARHAHGLRAELEVQDLGFCAWGRESQRLQRDTTIAFEGITVANILELDEAVIGERQLLDTLGIRFAQGPYSTLLPFRLSARVGSALGEQWRGAIEVDQRNLPGYVPQVSFIAERRLGGGTEAGFTLSMGGFGLVRLGLSATHRIKQRWLFGLGTPHAPAFLTGSTRGAGLSVIAACAF